MPFAIGDTVQVIEDHDYLDVIGRVGKVIPNHTETFVKVKFNNLITDKYDSRKHMFIGIFYPYEVRKVKDIKKTKFELNEFI